MNYELYMGEALAEAQAAVARGDRPHAAVAVLDEAMVARGRDKVRESNDPTAHAVVVALAATIAGPALAQSTSTENEAPTTLSAITVWLCGNPDMLALFELPGQGLAFLAASTAFVVDIVVSIAVSLVTEPKPVSELKGLVYSETPKEDLVDPDEAGRPWYQRTLPLAAIAAVMVLILNFAF